MITVDSGECSRAADTFEEAVTVADTDSTKPIEQPQSTNIANNEVRRQADLAAVRCIGLWPKHLSAELVNYWAVSVTVSLICNTALRNCYNVNPQDNKI